MSDAAEWNRLSGSDLTAMSGDTAGERARAGSPSPTMEAAASSPRRSSSRSPKKSLTDDDDEMRNAITSMSSSSNKLAKMAKSSSRFGLGLFKAKQTEKGTGPQRARTMADELEQIALDKFSVAANLKSCGCLNSKHKWLWRSFFVIIIWLIVGTVFYQYQAEFTRAQAFYFGVQSGLSVGYGASGVTCADATGDGGPTSCRWYTVFHIIVGSTLISTALGVWISAVVEHSNNELDSAKKLIMVGSPTANAARGVYIPGYRKYGAVLAFISWLAVGVIFGMSYEVAAMSTGGLEAPSTDDQAMWFTGWFTLIGVPLYGAGLATLANFIVEEHTNAQKNALLQDSLTEDDMDFLTKIDKEGDGVGIAEYLQMYMLKLGMMSQNDLDQIKEKFAAMDIDGNHVLSPTEMVIDIAFSENDLDGSGDLDRGEFLALLFRLDKLPRARSLIQGGLPEFNAAFDEISKGDGTVTRKEFEQWWYADAIVHNVQAAAPAGAVEQDALASRGQADVPVDAGGDSAGYLTVVAGHASPASDVTVSETAVDSMVQPIAGRTTSMPQALRSVDRHAEHRITNVSLV